MFNLKLGVHFSFRLLLTTAVVERLKNITVS